MNANKYFFVFVIIFSFIFNSCSESTKEHASIENIITSIELSNPEPVKVDIDNFAHILSFKFNNNDDISKVNIKINLASGYSLDNYSQSPFQCNLNDVKYFLISGNNNTIKYGIVISYSSATFTPPKGWEKLKKPDDYINVYRYTEKINDKNVNAYIAVADVNNKNTRFKVLGKASGESKTLTQFYNSYNKPCVVINGGYFWAGASLGLIVQNGTIIKNPPLSIIRKYNGVNTSYYATQGAFGKNTNGSYSATWVYPVASKLYSYSKPSENKAGEAPKPKPSENYPVKGEVWNPVEAIGAGPLLITKGEYKNMWQYELFDKFSGVGPNSNHPRTAIAYAKSGHLVLFVCEGRNKSQKIYGLNLKEVSDLLLELGCVEAINLDGGGSSCMLVDGNEVFVPSDGKQRSIPNVVVIY